MVHIVGVPAEFRIVNPVHIVGIKPSTHCDSVPAEFSINEGRGTAAMSPGVRVANEGLRA